MMNYLINFVPRLWREEDGAETAEWIVVVALILAVAAAIYAGVLQTALSTVVGNIAGSIATLGIFGGS